MQLPSLVFSIGIFVVFLVMLRYAWKKTPFLAFVLLLMVVYEFVTEWVGLRFGDYYFYSTDFLFSFTTSSSPPFLNSCSGLEGDAARHCTPPPVFLMEACLLFAVMKATDFLFYDKGDETGKSPPMFVKPLTDALIIVAIDVMLDPILSNSAWDANAVVAGSSFGGAGFWTWQTSEAVPGYWFGVPLFNYIAWWSNNFCFIVMVRLMHHRYNMNEAQKMRGFLAALGVLFLALLLQAAIAFVFFANDRVTQWLPFEWRGILNLYNTAFWQWSVIGVIFLGSLTAIFLLPRMYGRSLSTYLRKGRPLRWPLVLTQIFLFAFCLVALPLTSSLGHKLILFLVWLICLLIVGSYAVAPSWGTRLPSWRKLTG